MCCGWCCDCCRKTIYTWLLTSETVDSWHHPEHVERLYTLDCWHLKCPLHSSNSNTGTMWVIAQFDKFANSQLFGIWYVERQWSAHLRIDRYVLIDTVSINTSMSTSRCLSDMGKDSGAIRRCLRRCLHLRIGASTYWSIYGTWYGAIRRCSTVSINT